MIDPYHDGNVGHLVGRREGGSTCFGSVMHKVHSTSYAQLCTVLVAPDHM